MAMESEELVELMEKVEEKGIGRDKVEEETKVSYELLRLYANSGPVPGRIIGKLKELIEGQGEGG